MSDTSRKALESALSENHNLVVSEGTHESYDLFAAYGRAMAAYAPEAHQQMFCPQGMTPDYLRAFEEGRSAEYWDSEDAGYIVDEMAEALDGVSPDGYYFGAHEGDGACMGWFETEEGAAEREWAAFVEELDAISEQTVASLRPHRKVHLTDSSVRNGFVGPDCGKFVVFAFGAYGDTFVAVPYEVNPYHATDVYDALEVAAATLLEVAPGLFTDPDYETARDEMLAAGEITEEEHADRDSDEVADKVAQHAQTDMTHTESGWLLGWEWSIVSGDFTREQLLARGE
jgi:hypothetical protein